MTDPDRQDIARAQALGRAAARGGRRLDTNPYPREQLLLRTCWAVAFAGAGGLRKSLDGPAARTRAALLRLWYGNEG